MVKRLTIEEFIEKANIVHNYKYDYSYVIYINSQIKVKIKCDEHGIFEQKPNGHLNGAKCKQCGIKDRLKTYDEYISNIKLIHSNKYLYDKINYIALTENILLGCKIHGYFNIKALLVQRPGEKCPQCKNLNLEKFIERANIIHNNKYDYSLTKYNGIHNKIIIGCGDHYFEQSANNHLRGQTCGICLKRNLTTEWFIEQSIIKYGNYYIYEKTNYIDSKTKLEIECPKHGIFQKLPMKFLEGNECKKCNIETNQGKFLIKLQNIHNDKYLYDKINYTGYEMPILIGCRQHGYFNILAKSMLKINGSKCPQCKINCNLGLEKFIEKSIEIHGIKYDYSKAIYINSRSKIEIICKIHGSFYQKAAAHLEGYNCIKCCPAGVSEKEIKWLDSLNIKEIRQHRLNINKKIFSVDAYDPETNTIYEFYGDFWHGNPNSFNLDCYNGVLNKKFGELYLKTINREAKLIKAGYKIISIWEKDWDLKVENEKNSY